MDSLSKNEILNYAFDNGMIDINTIQAQIEMNERQKYLEMHTSRIWQSTDKKWYTYVEDATKTSGKKLIKRKTEYELNDFLVEYYKQYVERQTVEKTYREWIAKKIKFGEISKQTIQRYENDFTKYFAKIQDREIKYITTDFLDDFILDNIRIFKMRPRAWSNMRILIRGMFLFAKKKGYTNIKINDYLEELDLSSKIFNHTKKPKQNVIFKQREIDIMLEYMKTSPSLSDFAISFAIYTGMRVGEIVALKWEDIGEDFIFVNRTQIRYYDDDGKIVYEIRDFPKTEAGIRDVPIVPQLKKIIKRLREINPFTEYLFEKNGECIHKHTVCTRLYQLCDKFNFPHKGMHAIRKYFITKLINAKVDKNIIIAIVGHTDFETTKTHYYEDNSEDDYKVETITFAISG